jgi:hypothetical protein
LKFDFYLFELYKFILSARLPHLGIISGIFIGFIVFC